MLYNNISCVYHGAAVTDLGAFAVPYDTSFNAPCVISKLVKKPHKPAAAPPKAPPKPHVSARPTESRPS